VSAVLQADPNPATATAQRHAFRIRQQVIPTITANDPSAHLVMAVLDTAIHAFAFESRSRRESQPTLLGINHYKKIRFQPVDNF
jgi:hypothetical protein